MKKILLIIIFACVLACKAEQARDEIDYKIEETLIAPSSEDIDTSWLNDEMRAIVLGKLVARTTDRSEDNSFNRRQAEKALVLLGHVETIQRLAEAMNDPKKDEHTLLSFATEEAIPYIMPLVEHGSAVKPPMPPGHDVSYSAVRRTAVQALLNTIMGCEEFPPATVAWAKQMARSIRRWEDDEWVALLTAWYENNKTAILEKRYADATWLPRHKGKPTAYTQRENLLRDEHHERERAARTSRREPLPESSPVVTSNPSWPVWSALVAVLLILFAWFRWKRTAKAGS